MGMEEKKTLTLGKAKPLAMIFGPPESPLINDANDAHKVKTISVEKDEAGNVTLTILDKSLDLGPAAKLTVEYSIRHPAKGGGDCDIQISDAKKRLLYLEGAYENYQSFLELGKALSGIFGIKLIKNDWGLSV